MVRTMRCYPIHNTQQYFLSALIRRIEGTQNHMVGYSNIHISERRYMHECEDSIHWETGVFRSWQGEIHERTYPFYNGSTCASIGFEMEMDAFYLITFRN